MSDQHQGHREDPHQELKRLLADYHKRNGHSFLGDHLDASRFFPTESAYDIDADLLLAKINKATK